MYKRLLLMSTMAGALGLAAYSFTPVSAGAVQLSAGFSGIPAASDSNIILIEEKKGDKQGGGGSGGKDGKDSGKKSGSSTSGSSGSGSGSSTRQFKKRDAGSGTGSGSGGSSTRQFKQQGAGSGGGGGGNWQHQGRWHQGDRWSSGFWRGGIFIVEPFFIGDPCYDYIRVFDLRRGRWVWAWAYIC